METLNRPRCVHIGLAKKLQREIDADHRFACLRIGAGRVVIVVEIGSFVEIPPILDAKAGVGKEVPVKACAIDKHGPYDNLQVAESRAWRVDIKANATHPERIDVSVLERRYPVNGNLVRHGAPRYWLGTAEKAAVSWLGCVVLVAGADSVGNLVTDPGALDVAQFKHAAHGIGWRLSGVMA